MTKTIEFIEQNIFECKNHIQHLNNKINEDKKHPILVKYHKERIAELKPILQNLEQIKCELEAWEEVKKDKGVCEKQEFRGKDCKKVIQISCKIFPEGTEQYETFKKALEVENE